MLLTMICVLLASCSTQTAMPQAASKVTQANASPEAPVIPAKAAVQASTEAPVIPAKAAVQASTEAPVIPAKAAAQASAEAPVIPEKAAVQASTQAPVSPAVPKAAAAKAAKAPIPAPAAVDVKITLISAALVQNNHVGNEWGYAAAVNAQPIQIGETMNAKLNPADRLVLEASAKEADKYPDNGNTSREIAVSSLTEQQTTAQLDVIVTENRGRYSGNTAKWRFVFQIEK